MVQFDVPSRGLTLLKRAGVAVALLVAVPYVWAPVYRFPEPVTFTGSHVLNPYAGGHGTWQRANLHAHGRAWSGLTNGVQPDQDVVARYRSLGYDVAAVSDYERIAAQHGVDTLPVYEHGYNIGKVHQLAIGATRVEWFDFLLWQSTSEEQYVIDRVRKTAELVALAHPSLREAYSLDDLQKLSRYQLLEVVNGPFANDDVWDAALSSGHAVWALANDDTHDLQDPRRTAAAWNMIDAATPSTNDVIDALRLGRTYAVARTSETPDPGPAMDTLLARADFTDGRLLVVCTGAPASFAFIGQNGEIRKTVTGALAADYTLTPSDTYLRTVIRSPKTTIFLNPVLRYDGEHLPSPASAVDNLSTWLFRGSSALAAVVLIALLRRRRAPVLVPARQPALPGPNRKTA